LHFFSLIWYILLPVLKNDIVFHDARLPDYVICAAGRHIAAEITHLCTAKYIII
jgi:hypothetical protein